jgi:hypothetical protein
MYKGHTDPFSLAANEAITIPSNDFLKEDNKAVRFSLKWEDYSLKDENLKNRILVSGKLPAGNIRYRISVTYQGADLAVQQITSQVYNVSLLELVSPGLEAGEQVLDLYEPNPQFIWLSDLTPGVYNAFAAQYGSPDLFEIKVFEKKPGKSLEEVLGTAPIQRARTKDPFYRFPAAGIQLKNGVTYYWQVRCFLKGIMDGDLVSKVYAFRYVSNTDPAVQEVFRDLNLMLGADHPEILKQLDGYNAQVKLTINGRAAQPADLSVTANTVMQGKAKVKRAEIK